MIYIPENRDIVIFHVLYLKEIPPLKTNGEKDWVIITFKIFKMSFSLRM